MSADTPALIYGGAAFLCLCLPSHANSGVARSVNAEIERIKDAVTLAESIHGPAIREFNNTFVECGFENWDGYGAMPLRAEIRPRAQSFFKKCLEYFPAPFCGATPSGMLMLEWVLAQDRRFMVTISEKDKISYAGLFGEGETVKGTQSYIQDIPGEISRNLNRLYRR